jgi:hypothetical protein
MRSVSEQRTSGPYNTERAAATMPVLQSGGSAQNAIRQCRIGLIGGFWLEVTDGNAAGLSHSDYAPAYCCFVRDLHARLAAAVPGAIRFTAGYTGARYHIVIACAIALGLITVALPVAMLPMVGDARVLGIALAGGVMLWPLVRMLQANKPRSYQPHALPEQLV